MQALVLLLCAVIFGCFVYELAAVKPAWLDVAKGFIPRPEILTNPNMLYTAIGIMGNYRPFHYFASISTVQAYMSQAGCCGYNNKPLLSWVLSSDPVSHPCADHSA